MYSTLGHDVPEYVAFANKIIALFSPDQVLGWSGELPVSPCHYFFCFHINASFIDSKVLEAIIKTAKTYAISIKIDRHKPNCLSMYIENPSIRGDREHIASGKYLMDY